MALRRAHATLPDLQIDADWGAFIALPVTGKAIVLSL
jgi:hypothetical protein